MPNAAPYIQLLYADQSSNPAFLCDKITTTTQALLQDKEPFLQFKVDKHGID